MLAALNSGESMSLLVKTWLSFYEMTGHHYVIRMLFCFQTKLFEISLFFFFKTA